MSQNVLYDTARRRFALADINWQTDEIYCLLVNSSYTLNVSHLSLSSIDGSAAGPRDYSPSGNTVNFWGYPLLNKGVETNGAIYADPVRFITVPAGRPAVNAVVLYRKSSDNEPGNSPLIYYAGIATGLPITPNGGDIIVTWSTGTNRILRL